MHLGGERRVGPVGGVDRHDVEVRVHDRAPREGSLPGSRATTLPRPGVGSTYSPSMPTSASLSRTYRAARASPSPMVAASPVLTLSMRIRSRTNSTASSSRRAWSTSVIPFRSPCRQSRAGSAGSGRWSDRRVRARLMATTTGLSIGGRTSAARQVEAGERARGGVDVVAGGLPQADAAAQRPGDREECLRSVGRPR